LTLKNPDKIINVKDDIGNYYKYFKYIKSKSKYLKLVVKYLNQHGFVVTAYFVAKIKTR